MKRPALQNKWVAVLGMALRARKVFGTFEKRAPGYGFFRGGRAGVSRAVTRCASVK